jgi:hypothetical protein
MKLFIIRNFDKIVKLLFTIFISMFLHSCEEPEDLPAPEYGVVPMYGVKTVVVDK